MITNSAIRRGEAPIEGIATCDLSQDPDAESRRHWRSSPVHYGALGLTIGDQQVVQYWERPVMETMGRVATANGGNILEVGFGLGLSARTIAAAGCVSYTVIEAHPHVAERARRWSAGLPISARVIEDFWQDRVADLPDACFDGILFDTCPVGEDQRDVWYRGFIPHAARLLRAGGIFTYYAHQAAPGPLRDWRLLSRYFSAIEPPLSVPVNPGPDCQYWHADTLLVPIVRR